MDNLSAKIEALLFIYGEPMDVKRIAGILGVKAEEVKTAAEQLRTQLAGRGLALMENDGKYQLVTGPDHSTLLETVMKSELSENLTPAALETLSIVAYSGPISRAEIDYVRGVNSSFILRALSLRGLVEREVDPKRASAYVYKPSFDLLRHLGVSRPEDLPEYEKFRALAMKVKSPPPTEVPAGEQIPETTA